MKLIFQQWHVWHCDLTFPFVNICLLSHLLLLRHHFVDCSVATFAMGNFSILFDTKKKTFLWVNLLSHPCKSPSFSQPSVGWHVKAFMALYSFLQNKSCKVAEWTIAAHLISHCMIYLFRKVEKNLASFSQCLTLPRLKNTESFIMMLFRLCWACADSTLWSILRL